jgi:hypothetical protein
MEPQRYDPKKLRVHSSSLQHLHHSVWVNLNDIWIGQLFATNWNVTCDSITKQDRDSTALLFGKLKWAGSRKIGKSVTRSHERERVPFENVKKTFLLIVELQVLPSIDHYYIDQLFFGSVSFFIWPLWYDMCFPFVSSYVEGYLSMLFEILRWALEWYNIIKLLVDDMSP